MGKKIKLYVNPFCLKKKMNDVNFLFIFLWKTSYFMPNVSKNDSLKTY